MSGIWKLALAAVLALSACEQATEEASEEPTSDTTAAAEGISLSDLAGTWNMTTTSTDPANTTVNEYQIVIDESSWTLHFPDRDPVESTVSVEGDSIIVDSGPFESVRRPGTMVTTHTIFRLEGDRLVGDVTAHWQTTDPDSVGRLRTEGARTP